MLNSQFFEIDECLSLAKKTFYSTCKYNHTTKYDICLPYHPCFESIIYPLKLLGFSLSFSYPATIGNVMIRNSPLYDEGTVYMIPCQCRRFYIGQTSKSLEKRITQHKYSVATNVDSNAISNHTRHCNFPMDWNKAMNIYSKSDYRERNLLESVCIEYSKKCNFNTSKGLYNTDPLLMHIVNNQYKIKNKIPSS